MAYDSSGCISVARERHFCYGSSSVQCPLMNTMLYAKSHPLNLYTKVWYLDLDENQQLVPYIL